MSIALALLLLASTTSWKVEKHYCLGHVVDISLFAASNGCGMEANDAADQENASQYENACCSDETIILQGQDDLAITFHDFTIDQQQLLVAFSYSYFNFLPAENVQRVVHQYYLPPNIVKDIQVLDGVFLI